MKAQDLRVGNWVLNLRDNKPDPITAIFEDHVNLLGFSYSSKLDEIAGIPLTPEILEVCGFERRPSADQSDSDYWEEVYVNGAFLVSQWAQDGDEDGPGCGGFRVVIGVYTCNRWCIFPVADTYFLHQLQNLDCSITGEELEIPGDKLREVMA